MKLLPADESLNGINFMENMMDQMYKINNKTDREELIFRCLNCKDDISNLLLMDKVEKQLEQKFNKNQNMTLKNELI